MALRLLRYSILVLLLLASPAFGQADAGSRDELLERVNTAVDGLENSDIKTFVKSVLLENDGPDRVSALTQTMERFQQELSPIGKSFGKMELIADEVGGSSYRRLTYGRNHEGGIVACQLTFYRTEKNLWRFFKLDYKLAENLLQPKVDDESEAVKAPIELAKNFVTLFLDRDDAQLTEKMKEHGTELMIRSCPPNLAEKISLELRLANVNGNSTTGQIDLLKCEVFAPNLVRVHLCQRTTELGHTWQVLCYKAEDEWKVSYFLFFQNDATLNGVKAFVANRSTEAALMR
jgi:hypothetical protein